MSNVPFAAQMEDLAAYFASKIAVPTIGVGGGFAPIGTIISFMGTTAPQDYLACDGTAYNIADYPQLADFITAQFGAVDFFGGNGTTTFAVPDLRGEFLRGTGTNSHTNQGSGANVGVHQDGTLHQDIKGYDNYLQSSKTLKANIDSEVTDTTGRIYVSGSQDGAAANANFTSRPTNTSILYCIKARSAGYSTEEHVVSEWIDGKPIYQRVVNYPNGYNVPSGTFITIGIIIPNIDLLLDIRKCGIKAGDGFTPSIRHAIDSDGTISIFADYPGVIRALIIEYTKTTD